MVFDENKKYSNVFLVKCRKNAKQGMVMEKPIIITRK
jgi:tRNA1(Val) A37 N6-methylase TrmN6